MTLHWTPSFAAFLFSLGPGLALITALLATKGPTRAANAALSVVVASLTYYTAVHDFILAEHLGYFPPFVAVPMPLAYLIAPGLYLYVTKLLGADRRFHSRDILHLIPFLLSCALVVPTLGISEAHRAQFFQRSFFAPRWFHLFAVNATSGIYLLSIGKELKRYESELRELTSNPSPYRLVWLKSLLASFWALWIWVTCTLLSGLSRWGEEAMLLTSCYVIFGMAIFALRQSGIFWETGVQLRLVSGGMRSTTVMAAIPRYKTSGLSAETAATQGRRLIQYLESSQAYLNADLKLTDLARALRVTVYQMSQIINVGLDDTFYSLINRYRIEEAQRRLLDPRNRESSILDLAFAIGFNSKSAFNTAFLKLTGQTPSQFRESTPQPMAR